ncbi:MAG: hypothetical protein V4577_11605 [Bacteroidota bacterium]
MMVREIISEANPSIALKLPKEMVGKTVEIIAFEIEADKKVLTKAERLKQIEELTKPSLVDLSGFKFDRNEANNYDE